ncbi:Aromatic acid exporter family member 1 [Geodermatophilus telluris]|uniref:Aromatic acid exporter family member 1 n=1 Tax=Geodermatophilus telluris TaxID=1190417 RepID=A0A1G6TDB8_9ACTN|nr:aromatic acid exporter family protein [Geodermatophilus telluris]SDD27061.1 Aromatic acid exporter family member 1 [Geodermatophilus telluris]
MAPWRRSGRGPVPELVAGAVHLVRRRARSAAFRALRLTGATVAAYVVAQLVGLHDPPPLIAALTALLVVQATLTSTLVNGVQRVLSVVAGVALAVGFVAVVGLTWWSLGALVAAAIVVGQLLRLGPHLVEVPISAMLVLGVGASGAESYGGDRVLETLLGAAVGMLVNVAFPPAVRTRHAIRSVERFAGEIAALLDDAAGTLLAGPVSPEQSARWLQDARRLNRHVPRLDRALAHAEESRRLNVRALRSPWAPSGVRAGLDALEYTSVSLRTLFRAVDDATRERTGIGEDAGYADTVRRTTASLLERMGTVVQEFGRALTAGPGDARRAAEERLASALTALASGRALVADLLIGDPRSRTGLWELNSALLTTVDRMLDELGPGPAGAAEALPAPRAALLAPHRLRLGRRPS